MMNSHIMALLAVVICSASVSVSIQDKKVQMDTDHVGLLRRGPKWTPESTPEIERIQAEHQAHIGRMAESGKLISAGPFMDDGHLRGIFVFKVGSAEEARALAEADLAVKAGRLVVELHPWMVAKGVME
jgi:uncharacterized protein YciI